jgi:hypothetical protein
MSDLDLLYQLNEDPDSYWVVYDLCLLNGWAEINTLVIEWFSWGYGSACDGLEYSNISGRSNSSIRWSKMGSYYRSSLHEEIYSICSR